MVKSEISCFPMWSLKEYDLNLPPPLPFSVELEVTCPSCGYQMGNTDWYTSDYDKYMWKKLSLPRQKYLFAYLLICHSLTYLIPTLTGTKDSNPEEFKSVRMNM